METILLDTIPVRDGCWATRINLAYLERLSPELVPKSSTSVVIVDEAEYDEKGQALLVRGAPMQPVVIGISDTALVLIREPQSQRSAVTAPSLGSEDGDQVFLSETKSLPAWAQEGAEQILTAIREFDDGHLQRGERNKFVNRPNNFWTITAQPRARGFAITVYGRPHLFKGEAIEVLNDRPGHSRFVVRDKNEIAEAIRLIKQSKQLKS